MSKRFFSFGCSFTSCWWPTWNDYIGLNFDEYYNGGTAGSDNKNILYKFLQMDKRYNFTTDDYVVIMFTSFNRLSYVRDEDLSIHNIGDLVDHNLKVHPIGKNYNFLTAIYDSYIAIKSIKTILESRNIKFDFLQSMKHNFYFDDFKVKGEMEENLNECLSWFKYPIMENWCYENYDFNKEKVIWQDTKHEDGHPRSFHHYDFLKEFFPHFINEKTKSLYNKQQEIFTTESQLVQGKGYVDLLEKAMESENIIYSRM